MGGEGGVDEVDGADAPPVGTAADAGEMSCTVRGLGGGGGRISGDGESGGVGGRGGDVGGGVSRQNDRKTNTHDSEAVLAGLRERLEAVEGKIATLQREVLRVVRDKLLRQLEAVSAYEHIIDVPVLRHGVECPAGKLIDPREETVALAACRVISCHDRAARSSAPKARLVPQSNPQVKLLSAAEARSRGPVQPPARTANNTPTNSDPLWICRLANLYVPYVPSYFGPMVRLT